MGTNPALFYPDSEYAIDHSEKLPGSWKADGPTDAVLVVCMGETTFGSPVETCSYYQSGSSGAVSNVSFYKIAIPVKVYELRTGKIVVNRTIRINGTSCPETIYTSKDSTSEYVVETTSDVKAAFRPLVVR
ncbi:hypothetical protein QQY66_37860 [Streptomyces sp. DG2A-72]|uniref:hypothetical protein n=1 Tax=Streptomyces sp. DG2A-72 TaxID=3051386 RepID=UPI00265BEA80|nr:hypothetical protein [Streptomyces sp. DG2A-72]MDO0937208.1 hypothetical protein [Streptomyces sp. DG2A-72]